LEDLGFRWEDNVKMGLLEIRWEGVDLIHMGRIVTSEWGSCEHVNVPSCCIKNIDFLLYYLRDY